MKGEVSVCPQWGEKKKNNLQINKNQDNIENKNFKKKK